MNARALFYGISGFSYFPARASEKHKQKVQLFKLPIISIVVGPHLFLLAPSLFPTLATHLALKLMKALNLISCKNTPHLGPNAGINPDFIGLRRCQGFGSPAHLCFVKLLAHNRVVKRLPGLPETAAGADDFVVVTAADCLHAYSLFGANTDRLHNPLLQLLLFYLIWIQWAIAARQENSKGRAVDSALTRAVITPNLALH